MSLWGLLATLHNISPPFELSIKLDPETSLKSVEWRKLASKNPLIFQLKIFVTVGKRELRSVWVKLAKNRSPLKPSPLPTTPAPPRPLTSILTSVSTASTKNRLTMNYVESSRSDTAVPGRLTEGAIKRNDEKISEI